MVRRVFILVLFVFLVGFFALKPKSVDTIVQPELGAGSHLKYFGFAITDCLYDDTTTQEVETDYIDEVIDFSNVSHLCGFMPQQDISQRLELYRTVEIQALLYVESILFNRVPGGEGTGMTLSIHPEYQERWRTFARVNNIDSYSDVILAIHVADEPYWNNLSEADLATVSNFLEFEHPNLKQFTVFASPSVMFGENPTISFPDSFDYLAFDRYGTFDPRTDPTFLEDLNTLERALTGNQKIIIVFESMWNPLYRLQTFWRSEMANMTAGYYEVARERKSVVGLVGYPWPNDFDGPGIVGARGLTELHLVYRSIYNEITKTQ